MYLDAGNVYRWKYWSIHIALFVRWCGQKWFLNENITSKPNFEKFLAWKISSVRFFKVHMWNILFSEMMKPEYKELVEKIYPKYLIEYWYRVQEVLDDNINKETEQHFLIAKQSCEFILKFFS